MVGLVFLQGPPGLSLSILECVCVNVSVYVCAWMPVFVCVWMCVHECVWMCGCVRLDV